MNQGRQHPQPITVEAPVASWRPVTQPQSDGPSLPQAGVFQLKPHLLYEVSVTLY